MTTDDPAVTIRHLRAQLPALEERSKSGKDSGVRRGCCTRSIAPLSHSCTPNGARISAMARKRPAPDPQPEQLVFPFQLRLGDVVLEDGSRAEVVGAPISERSGKTTRAWVQHQGEPIQREAVWDAWRKLRVVRSPAA